MRGTFATVAASLAVGLTVVVLYAWLVEPRLLTVTRLDLPAPLDQALAGQRVVFVSDPHIGPDWSKAEKLLDRLRCLKPDYLLIGGDLAAYGGRAEPVVDFLKRLPETKGTYAVLGDSDYAAGFRNCLYCHRPGSREPRDDLPVTFLRNQPAPLAEGRVTLVGLDGEAKGGWPVACARGRANDTPLLVLGHFPQAAEIAAPYDPALVLAGDTHGGQIVGLDRILPTIPTYAGHRLAYGWYNVAGAPLFVSRGLGESLLPLRLGRTPEIVVLEGAR